MKINKEYQVEITDDYGCVLTEGSQVVYQTNDKTDYVGKFVGFKEGYLVFENILDKNTRRLFPKSVKKMCCIYDVTKYELPFKSAYEDENEE